ncbi:MAG TPA: S8/S53 family peptidase [Baekduia sp.]
MAAEPKSTTIAPRRALPAAFARLLAVATATLAIPLSVSTDVARAEEVFTSQAAATNATDSTWIPAPPRRAAVCIVDTGNDITPDTTNVVARFAVDGGTGEDLSPTKHGTLMSTIASAPYNGFGMVGAAPSIDVVSVRASRDGRYFGGDDLATAVQLCVTKRSIYNIRVVSMSLGSGFGTGGVQANAGQRADFQSMIDNARAHSLNVVAAAGNSGLGIVDWPAGYGPTFAVGAADNHGARCEFASWGPDVDIWAPGCPLDVARPDQSALAAWAYGSSEATAFTAGVLTQLRGLSADLGVVEAEAALRSNATGRPVGPFLDVAAGFRGSDLEAQLTEGHTAAPEAAVDRAPVASTPSMTTSATPPSAAQPVGQPTRTLSSGSSSADTSSVSANRSLVLPTPSVMSARVRRGLLTIDFRRRPRDVEARVDVYARIRRHAFPVLTRKLHSKSDRVRTRFLGMVTQVSITYRDPTGARRASPSVTIRKFR